MNSCEQIRTAMMAYDWIGFDLFDTLLLRPFLQPDDLFCQMEQELQVPDFAALRSQTENQLRQGRKRELTFLEIYQAIQQKTGVSDAVIQQWMDLELELEWRYCYPRESGLSLYCAAKEAGKHIAIVTDMYLPIDQIVRMLQKVGAGDYDLLLLSSELGYSKANGGIYRQLKRMEIPPKQFLQIGDNRIADVENPRCLGLQGMWLPAARAVFQHYGRLYPAIQAEQPSLAERCSVALAVNTYFDDPFRMMRRECDWNADPYFMGLLLPNAEHLPEVVTQDFMFQRGQERAMQLATHFFEHPLPAAQGQSKCSVIMQQRQTEQHFQKMMHGRQFVLLVDFPPCQSRKSRQSGKLIYDCCGNFFQLVERKKIRTCCETRADFIVFAKLPYGMVVVVVSV